MDSFILSRAGSQTKLCSRAVCTGLELKCGTSVFCKRHLIKNPREKSIPSQFIQGQGMEKKGWGEMYVFNGSCASLICT